jgi:hypothetical protein
MIYIYIKPSTNATGCPKKILRYDMYTIIAYIKEFLENQYVADCKETLK